MERDRLPQYSEQLLKELFYDEIAAPLGVIYLVFRGLSLAGVEFSRPPLRKKKSPKGVREQFAAYFNGKLRAFDLKTEFLFGSDFLKNVWHALKEIPYGETRSYKWLAEKVGSPDAMRAVGQALKRNPLPLIFPCHRVIEADGSLGGYSSGVDIKRRLLDLEYYNSMDEKTK
ncbi:MAG: methylated-DNA--[protein]-cysteine S-methyltransferase [bacterium]